MKQLLQQAQFKEQLQVAERDIARGDKIQASIQLEGLTSSVVGQPAYAGELASMMVRAGDINSAVDVVNNSLSEGSSPVLTSIIIILQSYIRQA